MWRSHFVVLGEKPSKSSLAHLKDGYQLWRESTTGLFYLTAYNEPLGRRPDFSQFLDRQTEHRIDTSLIEQFIADRSSVVAQKKSQVNFDLIQQTATMAEQLGMRVLAAEDTDDEYGMAVLVDHGAVQYLRFKTMLKAAPELKGGVEVVYTPEAGFVIDYESAEDAYGAAQKSIAEVYSKAGLNLYEYGNTKPTREQAKQLTANRDISIRAYLDRYGVFNRVCHAPPQITQLERFLIPFRYVASAILIPFLVVGMLAYILLNEGKPDPDRDPKGWRIILLGAAVLALPILMIVWLLKAMLGY
jgi:hypothetical protein